jgi:hypothetical protein
MRTLTQGGVRCVFFAMAGSNHRFQALSHGSSSCMGLSTCSVCMQAVGTHRLCTLSPPAPAALCMFAADA